MTVEIVFMAVSAVVMAFLLVHRHVERSRGSTMSPVRAMRQKTGPALSDVHAATGEFFSHITLRNLVLGLNHAIVFVVRFFMRVTSKAHDVSSNIVLKASKKTEDLSKRGAASFYLKQIKDAKDNGTEGK